MTNEKLKIKVIKKVSDLEKIAKGDVVIFKPLDGGLLPIYGIISYKGEENFALIKLDESENPELGVAWKLYGFSEMEGVKGIQMKGNPRYPFKAGSAEHESYKSRLTELRDLIYSKNLRSRKIFEGGINQAVWS